MDHPRKKASPTPSQQTMSPEQDTQGEKDRPTTDTKKASEPAEFKDVLKKLRKDSSGYGFIPLSYGKLLDDVWWEPFECVISDARRSNGIPWLIMAVRIFINTAGITMGLYERPMEVRFKCGYDEVEKICYLKDRTMKALHSERIYSYEDWLRKMYSTCNLSECESESEFAKRCFDYVNSLVITRIPDSFHILLCKRLHNLIRGMDTTKTEENLNSILCEAIGKKTFHYEFRCGIFLISNKRRAEKMKEIEREELADEEEDDLPATQPLY